MTKLQQSIKATFEQAKKRKRAKTAGFSNDDVFKSNRNPTKVELQKMLADAVRNTK